MRQASFILIALAFLLVGCKNQTYREPAFNREIPTYLFGIADIYYQLAKERQQQLGLDSPENGYHDLQIRVWYNGSFAKEQKLVVITNKDTSWAAAVYDFQVDNSSNTGTILSKSIRQVTPKSGWSAFSKQLLDLQVLTLLNQDDVEGYSAGADGTTYSVEAATKHQYRFYNYWEPQQYQEEFWQAKNMTGIVKLFETELGI